MVQARSDLLSMYNNIFTEVVTVFTDRIRSKVKYKQYYDVMIIKLIFLLLNEFDP